MALVIADRVKETTITEGVGTLTLSGATFGGFQTFEDTIGDGNQTYYCIENYDQFEIGIGEYTQSTNTLSRATVLQSSNNDNKINLTGNSIVFCVVPAEKLLYDDQNNSANITTPLVLKRSDDGDYWQALSTNYTNRIASFYIEEGIDPTWKLGLKTTTSSLIEPFYAYISAKDGLIRLEGNVLSNLVIGDGDSEGLQVNHQFKNIIDLRKNGGEIAVENLDLNSDVTTTAKNLSVGDTVFAVEAPVGHFADLQTWSVSTDEKASLDHYGNFSADGNITSPSGWFCAIRFCDGTIQTTAAVPGSGGGAESVFQNDLTVSLGGGKTFGRYLDGEVIPASGKTAGQVIQLAIVENQNPSASLSASPSTIETGTVAVSVSLNFSYTINNLGASVDTVSLEFRRGNTGAWTVLSTNPGITNYNHNFTNGSADQINYRYIVTDTLGDSVTVTKNVNFSYKVFYGPSSSVPTTSADVRSLPSNVFSNAGSTITLNTGDTELNFTAAMPSSQTISQVIDLDALNANITSEYINNIFNVDDAGGNPVSYNVYTMTISVPYSSNHRHQITKG